VSILNRKENRIIAKQKPSDHVSYLSQGRLLLPVVFCLVFLFEVI